MAEYTAGPWHLGFAKSGARYIYSEYAEQPIKPNVRVNKTTSKEIVGNATLMAAAPDLLAVVAYVWQNCEMDSVLRRLTERALDAVKVAS